ncbi:hypothetical protein PR202_gb05620 [Eleusine coracana subsp. coracana]|uniref:Uncharacterized protein n=1 Tax=Eleusine coracana subsp. coracana TaxID=191504 RepID=A0AAV5E749_ELECO|nr:hypothetical protein PR202_gb05620 [Eleusine coracana subsp. coracana]
MHNKPALGASQKRGMHCFRLELVSQAIRRTFLLPGMVRTAASGSVSSAATAQAMSSRLTSETSSS